MACVEWLSDDDDDEQATGGIFFYFLPEQGLFGAALMAGVCFSHWLLDLLVHVRDLPQIPLVTAAAAVVLALLQTGLMLNVSLGRAQSSTGLGDGGNEGLLRRIRMHGNLAENAAIFLVLSPLRVVGATGTVIAFICTAALLAVSVAGRLGFHG